MRFRELLARVAPWSWVAALVFWGVAIWIWVDRFLGLLVVHSKGWLFDWHVYAAAAKDLVQGDAALAVALNASLEKAR